MSDEGLRSERRGEAITVTRFPFDDGRATLRDSKNIERSWRRFKALYLLDHADLSRLLGRRVK